MPLVLTETGGAIELCSSAFLGGALSSFINSLSPCDSIFVFYLLNKRNEIPHKTTKKISSC